MEQIASNNHQPTKGGDMENSIIITAVLVLLAFVVAIVATAINARKASYAEEMSNTPALILFSAIVVGIALRIAQMVV
jgi:cytochrome bd-type quinol oxidase subunit 2